MANSCVRSAAVMLAMATIVMSVPGKALAPGDAAPAFALPDARGATVALENLRGRVVVVDFWASWCGPCKRSFPWMSEMQRRYGDRGLSIVAVNVDKRLEDAAKFLATTPGDFTIVYDPSGASPAAWDVKGMPTSYLVDRSGRIVSVESGFRDESKGALEARIQAALGAK
ncbi:MAG TPA: TlpA disulfide reductase family protein [Casimicrobiaceae bacterium]|mgnify:CR=1 FL=1|nr:TlpA disulfide reductase family protein [Casimicrobiaceae bacterium]